MIYKCNVTVKYRKTDSRITVINKKEYVFSLVCSQANQLMKSFYKPYRRKESYIDNIIFSENWTTIYIIKDKR